MLTVASRQYRRRGGLRAAHGRPHPAREHAGRGRELENSFALIFWIKVSENSPDDFVLGFRTNVDNRVGFGVSVAMREGAVILDGKPS